MSEARKSADVNSDSSDDAPDIDEIGSEVYSCARHDDTEIEPLLFGLTEDNRRAVLNVGLARACDRIPLTEDILLVALSVEPRFWVCTAPSGCGK